MKKILALFITALMAVVLTLPISAANADEKNSVDYWLEKAKSEALEDMSDVTTRHNKDDITYFFNDINDDLFFAKIYNGKHISDYINEKYWNYLIYSENYKGNNGWDYATKISDYWSEYHKKYHPDYYERFDANRDKYCVTFFRAETFDILNFFSQVDDILKSKEIGNIKNVSFLSYEANNTFHGGTKLYLWTEKCSYTYNAIFAYIESDQGEFLVPYVISGTNEDFRGTMGLENGKLYEVYECAETMYNNMYIVIDDFTDIVDDGALENDPLYGNQGAKEEKTEVAENPDLTALGIGMSAGTVGIGAGFTALVKKKKKR